MEGFSASLSFHSKVLFKSLLGIPADSEAPEHKRGVAKSEDTGVPAQGRDVSGWINMQP